MLETKAGIEMKQILLVEDVATQAKALKSIIQSHIQDVQITIASKQAGKHILTFQLII